MNDIDSTSPAVYIAR